MIYRNVPLYEYKSFKKTNHCQWIGLTEVKNKDECWYAFKQVSNIRDPVKFREEEVNYAPHDCSVDYMVRLWYGHKGVLIHQKKFKGLFNPNAGGKWLWSTIEKICNTGYFFYIYIYTIYI